MMIGFVLSKVGLLYIGINKYVFLSLLYIGITKYVFLSAIRFVILGETGD